MTTDGQVYLLTLARHAPLDADDLRRMCASQVAVEVDFSGEPNMTGGVAHRVRRAVEAG